MTIHAILAVLILCACSGGCGLLIGLAFGIESIQSLNKKVSRGTSTPLTSPSRIRFPHDCADARREVHCEPREDHE